MPGPGRPSRVGALDQAPRASTVSSLTPGRRRSLQQIVIGVGRAEDTLIRNASPRPLREPSADCSTSPPMMSSGPGELCRAESRPRAADATAASGGAVHRPEKPRNALHEGGHPDIVLSDTRAAVSVGRTNPFEEELALLHPTPGDLRAALSRHADAVVEDERYSTPGTVRRRKDTAYTLCVMTGVTDVKQALSAADALLRASAPRWQSRRREESGRRPFDPGIQAQPLSEAPVQRLKLAV